MIPQAPASRITGELHQRLREEEVDGMQLLLKKRMGSSWG